MASSPDQLGRIGGRVAGHIGDNSYRAAYADDSRSKCQDANCRRTIAPGSLRIGKNAPSVRHGHSPKTKWFHLDCAFASFARVCKRSKTITTLADVAGVDALHPADAARLEAAIAAYARATARPPPPPPPDRPRRAAARPRAPRNAGGDSLLALVAAAEADARADARVSDDSGSDASLGDRADRDALDAALACIAALAADRDALRRALDALQRRL
jgi:hypothetical protein